MTIKEIFDMATTENKSLTWDQFEALVKGSKAKFADLSEGKYVDKQKYDDDLAKRDTEIQTLNDAIAARTDDMASLQEQLKNAGTDSAKLEELTNNLASLQTQYDADTKRLQEQLTAKTYEFAVRDFANGQKFSSSAAKREFERAMIQKNLPMENGKIMGASDWLKEYTKENKDSFVSDTPTPPEPKSPEPPKPQFAGPASGNSNSGPKMSLSEMMQRKNEDPNFVIDFG